MRGCPKRWYNLLMLILFHIAMALSSLVYATHLLFKPTVTRLRVTYSLSALTLASGTYLVWLKPVHIVSACTSGLLYLGFTAMMITLARRKLAKQTLPTQR